jgi:hypothetical protein
MDHDNPRLCTSGFIIMPTIAYHRVTALSVCHGKVEMRARQNVLDECKPYHVPIVPRCVKTLEVVRGGRTLLILGNMKMPLE